MTTAENTFHYLSTMLLKLSWRKIILAILILTILVGLTGCQLQSGAKNFGQEIARLPDRLMVALTDLLGSVKDIGRALSSQIGSIARNLIGR